MGRVYAARDLRLGRKVALKVVRPERLQQEGAVERFVDEAKTTARFSHPNIIAIHHVGTHAGAPYVALEYLEGEDLRARIDGSAPLGCRETARIGLAIAEALSAAHRAGILHRDLKPRNVFVPTDGRLRVLDFGLAMPVHDLDARTLRPGEVETTLPEGTRTKGIAGTPAYIPREVFKGSRPTEATDIWALGLILCELGAGVRPYSDRDSLFELIFAIGSLDPVPMPTGLPPAIADVAAPCLRKDPKQRPSADEVVEQLRSILRGGASRTGDQCPFPGLQAFGDEQAEVFFGRESETDLLVERLRTEAVVPIVGPSGAGKSSLVRGGLIPRLQESGEWRVISHRPGHRPFANLAAALPALARGGDGAAEAVTADRLRQSPRLLGLHLEELAREQGERVLFVVDQLEELFTQGLEPETTVRYLQAVLQTYDL